MAAIATAAAKAVKQGVARRQRGGDGGAGEGAAEGMSSRENESALPNPHVERLIDDPDGLYSLLARRLRETSKGNSEAGL
eukprot:SAG11_NODE_1110_length_5824_cov_7.340087_3_plen_80_part_00